MLSGAALQKSGLPPTLRSDAGAHAACAQKWGAWEHLPRKEQELEECITAAKLLQQPFLDWGRVTSGALYKSNKEVSTQVVLLSLAFCCLTCSSGQPRADGVSSLSHAFFMSEYTAPESSLLTPGVHWCVSMISRPDAGVQEQCVAEGGMWDCPSGH